MADAIIGTTLMESQDTRLELACMHLRLLSVFWFCFTDIIPRSVLMASFSGANYLLCALGDGCLLYYHLDPDSGTVREGGGCLLSYHLDPDSFA